MIPVISYLLRLNITSIKKMYVEISYSIIEYLKLQTESEKVDPECINRAKYFVSLQNVNVVFRLTLVCVGVLKFSLLPIQ